MKTYQIAGLLLITNLIASGCASTTKLSRLNQGMSKSEALSAMGTPDDTEMKNGAEYMRYFLYDGTGVGNHYLLQFTEGKLDSYQRLGTDGPPMLLMGGY